MLLTKKGKEKTNNKKIRLISEDKNPYNVGPLRRSVNFFPVGSQ